MSEQITVVSSIPLPDIPVGEVVTVERTRRIDGLIASGKLTKIPVPEVYTAGDVPTSVADVKAWVDDGPNSDDQTRRAQVALDAEQARAGGPRPTLMAWLEGDTAPETPQDRPHDDMPAGGTTAIPDDTPTLTDDLNGSEL